MRFIDVIIVYVIYEAVSYKSAHCYFDDYEKILFHLVMVKSEIWFNNHCSCLGNETTVCVVCCLSSIYIYIHQYDNVKPMMLRHQRDKDNLSQYFQIYSKTSVGNIRWVQSTRAWLKLCYFVKGEIRLQSGMKVIGDMKIWHWTFMDIW